MKKSLFLYLFIIAALMNVFTYAYFSKQGKAEKVELEAQLKKSNDSVLVLYNKWDDERYFSLAYNQNAQEYFEQYDVRELIPRITNKVLDFNNDPNGNPLVPYEKINDKRFVVNKVKVLNHRWIIADFSDGKVWGEVLLKYFVEENKDITFERIDSQLYRPDSEKAE